VCVHCHCQMGAERNGTDATRGHTWTCGAGRTWVVYRRVGEAMVYHCRLPAGPSTANGGCVMNGPVVRRRVTFSTGQAAGAPPAPASNRRILPNRERCLLDTHVAPAGAAHLCSCAPPPASSPAAPRPRRSPPRARHARTPVNVERIKKSGPGPSYAFYGAYTARGRPGAGGGRRAEKTHARATQGYTCDQLATADLFRTHA
jgi:hypothetical protein